MTACSGQQKPASERSESREAKRLMQGVWLDDSESAVFQAKGDTVYYADSTSMPAYFRVVDDTLYIGKEGRYHIEKQTEHLLWFKSETGELTKLSKSDDEVLKEVFAQTKPQVLTLTQVLKRDTVVYYNGQRYHLYVAINPTKYKVSRHVLNEDGLDVENVYYDNIPGQQTALLARFPQAALREARATAGLGTVHTEQHGVRQGGWRGIPHEGLRLCA